MYQLPEQKRGMVARAKMSLEEVKPEPLAVAAGIMAMLWAISVLAVLRLAGVSSAHQLTLALVAGVAGFIMVLAVALEFHRLYRALAFLLASAWGGVMTMEVVANPLSPQNILYLPLIVISAWAYWIHRE